MLKLDNICVYLDVLTATG